MAGPSYPKTGGDDQREERLGDGKRNRSPVILIAVIVLVVLVLMLVLHLTGVVGPGTNM